MMVTCSLILRNRVAILADVSSTHISGRQGQLAKKQFRVCSECSGLQCRKFRVGIRGDSVAEGDRGRKSFNNPCPEDHNGPEDTEEKRSFQEIGVKCLYLYSNRRLLGQVGLGAGCSR